MNCDRAQAVLSDRLDGERAPDRVGATVDEHITTCTRCRAFEANALRLRTSLRVRLAEPVPDLVGTIMARVASESLGERLPMLPTTVRPRPSTRRCLTPLIAATLAGHMAGSVVESIASNPSMAAAAAITWPNGHTAEMGAPRFGPSLARIWSPPARTRP